LSDGGKDRKPHSPAGSFAARRGNLTEGSCAMADKKFTDSHKKSMRCRGLDPKDYVFVKETYVSLYIRNIHTGVVKIIYKHN
jgi:hypothetical protein